MPTVPQRSPRQNSRPHWPGWLSSGGRGSSNRWARARRCRSRRCCTPLLRLVRDACRNRPSSLCSSRTGWWRFLLPPLLSRRITQFPSAAAKMIDYPVRVQWLSPAAPIAPGPSAAPLAKQVGQTRPWPRRWLYSAAWRSAIGIGMRLKPKGPAAPPSNSAPRWCSC